MDHPALFRPYNQGDYADCLALFDQNCPKYFVEVERQDYCAFLKGRSNDYQVMVFDNVLAGGVGLVAENEMQGRIQWILLSETVQGKGLGRRLMEHVISAAKRQKLSSILIAASHLSAPFFSHFGAQTGVFTEHGWGPGMHRVDMVIDL